MQCHGIHEFYPVLCNVRKRIPHAYKKLCHADESANAWLRATVSQQGDVRFFAADLSVRFIKKFQLEKKLFDFN